ncbi:small glutamine-rich tetratricopeptide repeat-containing protein alpha-like isoform X2 [Limulus polyphemus]|uniref:Small glutamine-rich tetratricopeptide repeat-containing protein alpha-like isoform X2 n=1 Tax=Limulus polyphemus TaxID=6850 RepID=A0ABM1BPS8_LIMPO|nr:small glutamine-rich tetratricopeptide repeat-containing protein alpha-like isoform X2 [Limulus polyphemus]
MSEVKRLVAAIIQFLGDQLHNGDLTSDAKESLEIAIQCLETAYAVRHDSPTTASVTTNRSLLEIFSDATQRQWCLGDGLSSTLPPQASEQDKEKAEKLKNEGNNLMKLEKYTDAIECYTKAIKLDGSNAVYYCNRAAAHSKLNDHHAAIEDCEIAIRIDSTYSKAYGRMGLAFASLDQHARARDCYKKAVDLDPHNESYITNLRVAEERLKENPQGSAGAQTGEASGNVPNTSLNFSSLLTNPTLMNMATQLMQDSNMQNIGQQLAAQMQASNPELVEQLRRQMGNQNPQSQDRPGPDQ